MQETMETIERGDIADVIADLINVQKTLRLFTHLMNETPDGWPNYAIDGMYTLQGQQIELLEAVSVSVNVKDGMLDEFRAKETAQAEKEPAATPRAMSLREEFIAAKAQAGENPGDIASAMNMKRVSIEKMIRRLQGEDGGEIQRAANS